MVRLDQDLVRRGLVRSRAEAVELIRQGRVLVDNVVATKAAESVDIGNLVEIRPGPRFVSRGGNKLAGALEHFGIDVTGKRCLDVGASTGGFTDCLLQRGAATVVAIDVGTGQLHSSLVGHPQVESRERTDIRDLQPEDFEEAFDLVVVDVAFVSICALAPKIAPFVAEHALILVKPQFEVGRAKVGRGVVSGEHDRQAAVDQAEACLRAAGLDTVGVVDSALPGERGNREIFLLLKAHT